MIQASELRIGNYVSEKVLGICPVGAINSRYVDLVKGDVYEIFLENIEPILLTPEILLACGPIEKGFKILPPVSNSKYRLFKDFDFGGNSLLLCELEYVHHLQNLIFHLTGKELEINPEMFKK